MTLYSHLALANNFLERSFRDKLPINLMQLQKHVYLAIALESHRTQNYASTELFEVWQYGPVSLSLQSYFKCFDGEALTTYYKDAKGEASLYDENALILPVVDRVWSSFKYLSPAEMARITILPNSAWDIANKRSALTIDPLDLVKDTSFHTYCG